MRLRAWLLLALFLSAGTSLPSLDAVLYHTRGAERPGAESHFDQLGGCGGHADHCTLNRTPPGSRSVQPRSLVVRLTTDISHSTPRALQRLEIAAPRELLPLPRAPPA